MKDRSKIKWFRFAPPPSGRGLRAVAWQGWMSIAMLILIIGAIIYLSSVIHNSLLIVFGLILTLTVFIKIVSKNTA